jgi:hypothetical protein
MQLNLFDTPEEYPFFRKPNKKESHIIKSIFNLPLFFETVGIHFMQLELLIQLNIFEMQYGELFYYIARLAKLFSKKFHEDVTFTFAVENKTEEKTEKTNTIPILATPMKEKKQKIDIEKLPIYSDPTLIIAGDKAKFPYDKAQTDWAMVDITKVEEAHSGYYIHWCFSHDKAKAFRTYVRPGNPIADEPTWIVATTITKSLAERMVKK